MPAQYDDILDQVAFVLAATRMKSPFVYEGETLPKTVVHGTGSRIVEQCFENLVIVAYRVVVTVFDAANGLLQSDYNLAEVLETIRQTLHKASLTNITAVVDVNDAELRDLEDPVGLLTNYDYAMIGFDFHAVQSRSI